MLGTFEIVIILVIGGVLFFGSKKISEVGRTLGKFSTEYKKGKMEAEKELDEMKKELEEVKDAVDKE